MVFQFSDVSFNIWFMFSSCRYFIVHFNSSVIRAISIQLEFWCTKHQLFVATRATFQIKFENIFPCVFNNVEIYTYRPGKVSSVKFKKNGLQVALGPIYSRIPYCNHERGTRSK